MKKAFLLFVLLISAATMGWGQANIAVGTPYTQNFNGIGNTTTATLPIGWKIENVTGARTVTTAYSSVANTTTAYALTWNTAMSSTASNGRWNFGGSSDADRAVGGISSGSASQSVNMFVQLTNNGSSSISNFTISYDAERYRNGTNGAGFSIRFYYSTTGETSSYTELTDYVLSFTGGNANNNGSTTNPMETKSVSSKTLNQSLAVGSSIYLVWSYSVTSGTTTSNAQALGIDNISITANGSGSGPDNPASFNASPFSTSQIDLTFSTNTNTNNVVIVYNSDGNFSTPSGPPPSVGTSFAGGTLLYNGTTSPVNHTGLSNGQKVYYKAWSYDGSNYSTGLTADATTYTPTINLSTATLTGFTYPFGSGPSAEKTFIVDGSYLSSDISISATTNYEISTGSGVGFVATNPITLTQSGGTVSSTTIYTRLKQDLPIGTYNSEVINITSSGAASKTVTCSGSVTCSAGSLPYVEDFNYSVGVLLTNNCWSAHSGSGGIAVTSASISYPGYLSSNVGNEISLNSTTEDDNRTISPQISGTIYASFLVNVSATNSTGDYFFHLGQTSIGSTFRGRIYAKIDASNHLAFGIAQSGTAEYTSFSYSLGTTYLIVLKYEIISGSGNDKASIYINPPLNAAIPSLGWITNTDASGTDLSEVGTVALRQGGTVAALLDGIRISTTWSDIVGLIPTFTGTGDWSETARWNTGSLPGSSSTVIIDGIATVSSAVTIKDVTIDNPYSLIISKDGSLSVTGTLTNNGSNSGLVIKSDATGTGSLITSSSPLATVERYLTNYTTTTDHKYHMISSPVTLQAIRPMFVANAPSLYDDFYKYDETATSNPWINTKDGDGNWNTAFESEFVVGRGYLVSYKDIPVSPRSFSGTLNSYSSGSPLVITCTYTEAGGKGWNLIGNPFSSALDWNLVTPSLGSGMDNALYYYDASTENYLYYIDINGGIGTGSRYIPAMQGFMVHAKSSGTHTVTLNDGMRAHSSQNFYKSAESLPGSLSLTVSSGGYEDAAFVYFHEGATTAFDGSYDAYKLSSYNTEVPAIYTISSDNKNVAINGLPELTEDLQIPVWFKAGTVGTYTLNADVTNMPATVFLKDLETGTDQNLRVNPEYTFTAGDLEASGRFLLHFSALGVDNGGNADNLNIYTSGNGIFITSGGNVPVSGDIFVYNLLGQQILHQRMAEGSLSKIAVNGPSGYYLVKVVTGQKSFTGKVFIR